LKDNCSDQGSPFLLRYKLKEINLTPPQVLSLHPRQIFFDCHLNEFVYACECFSARNFNPFFVLEYPKIVRSPNSGTSKLKFLIKYSRLLWRVFLVSCELLAAPQVENRCFCRSLVGVLAGTLAGAYFIIFLYI
jgi:hypothetical protein